MQHPFLKALLARTVVSFALVACSSFVIGQTTNSLPVTMVTATRVEQAVTDIVADVTVIERAEIERLGLNNLSQLLSRLPGIQTVTGSDAERVYIRGADSRMTALYIDGVRVDSQDGARLLGGGPQWELVPLSQIERVEVLRGPASAVYGSDAMGGVIQIFTRRGEASLRPYANFGVDSLGTQRLSTGLSGASEGWDYALGLGIVDSPGINTQPNVIHTPDKEAYTQRTASLRLGRQLSRSQRLELNSLDTQFDSRYVPFGGGIDYQAKAHLNTVGLKLRSNWSDIYSTDLAVNRSRISNRDDAPNNYVTLLSSVLFENRLRLAGGTLTASIEEKRDAFEAQPTSFDPAFSGNRVQNGLALGYGVQKGKHALQLNARSDRDSVFGSYQTGAISYGYLFSTAWRATAATGTAFRAPTLEQTYGPYGSLQLQPETNRSQEVRLQFAEKDRAFKAVIYQNDFTNLISSSPTTFIYFNVGKAVIQGLSLSARSRWNAYELRGSFDVLDPRDEITGRDLSLRARQIINIGADRQVMSWRIGAETKGIGERFNNATNTQRLPGYFLFSLTASTAINREWRFVSRLDNLADTKYQQVLNYANPGRTLFVGFNWQPSN